MTAAMISQQDVIAQMRKHWQQLVPPVFFFVVFAGLIVGRALQGLIVAGVVFGSFAVTMPTGLLAVHYEVSKMQLEAKAQRHRDVNRRIRGRRVAV